MNMLSFAISKEENRNEKLIQLYESELKSLPNGSLREKIIKNSSYFYLTYRKGNKVISQYIGKNYSEVKKIKEQLNRKKHIQELLKELYKEQKMIKKMEKLL